MCSECKTKAGKNFSKIANAGQKAVPKNLMTGQVFINLRVPKLEFSASRSLFSLFHQILHIFWSKIVKNLMPGQNLPLKT